MKKTIFLSEAPTFCNIREVVWLIGILVPIVCTSHFLCPCKYMHNRFHASKLYLSNNVDNLHQFNRPPVQRGYSHIPCRWNGFKRQHLRSLGRLYFAMLAFPPPPSSRPRTKSRTRNSNWWEGKINLWHYSTRSMGFPRHTRQVCHYSHASWPSLQQHTHLRPG